MKPGPSDQLVIVVATLTVCKRALAESTDQVVNITKSQYGCQFEF